MIIERKSLYLSGLLVLSNYRGSGSLASSSGSFWHAMSFAV